MHQFSCRLLALLMPVVLACSTAAIAQAPPSAPPAVTVAKPIVKEVVERDDYVGRFEAVDAVEIRARVSGYLQTVSFRDGAIVKLGDLLFTIDKRPYQAALDQAEAAVDLGAGSRRLRAERLRARRRARPYRQHHRAASRTAP